jgi:hypothetical protein
MVEVRPATADEMILAFLQADMESPSDRGKFYAASIARIGADKATLIGIHADPINPHSGVYRIVVRDGRVVFLLDNPMVHRSQCQIRIMPIELRFSSLAAKDCARQLAEIVWAGPFKRFTDGQHTR